MEIKNIILGIAILILTMFVTIYGIKVILPNIERSDFCGKMVYVQNTEGDCLDVGGVWVEKDENIEYEKIQVPSKENCKEPLGCYEDYDSAREKRAKKVFYIMLPLGILILVIGGFLFYLDAVGAGLMGGGVGTIVYGAGSYWQYGGNLFRFILSLLGLIAVIFLTYWFNRKFHKE